MPVLFPRLVKAAEEGWRAYIRHQFVLLLAAGELPEVCFRRYLVQDYLFLLHFARAWGLAVYKSDTLPEMRRAQRLVTATLAYTRFVLDRGLAGDRLDLEVALAPCVVGYAVIATERMTDPQTRLDGNPYREWLEIYSGSEYQGLAREAEAALDEQFARRGGEGRFASLAANFALATGLEADFWQMGLDAQP